MLEGLALSKIIGITTVLGVPGLIILIWYDYTRRTDKAAAEHREMVDRVLGRYRDDVVEIKKLYENNVHLVEDYQKAQVRFEKLFSDTISIVSLNTQTQTQLVDAIRTNQYCPVVRKGAP